MKYALLMLTWIAFFNELKKYFIFMHIILHLKSNITQCYKIRSKIFSSTFATS